MRKVDIDLTRKLGQTQPIIDSAKLEQSFRLIGAVPFAISGNVSLRFDFPKLAGKLLRNHGQAVPQHISDWEARLSAAHQRDRRSALSRLTWDGAQYSAVYQLRLESGEKVWIEEKGERISGDDKSPTQIMGVFTQIDRAKSDFDRAAYLSRFDERSGLMNAAAFAGVVNHTCALIRRQGTHAAYLRLRVTNLPDINSIYGFETGDKLIGQLGERLAQLLRTPDHLGRLGDCDFGICLIGADASSADDLLARLKEPLSDTPYPTPHGGLYLEFASAVTSLGGHAPTAADAALQTTTKLEEIETQMGWQASHYSPHDNGANSKDDLTPRSEEDSQMIIAALNERRISLAYQPIIDAKTRDLHHYECLLRLRSEDGEVISAGRVIMTAEKLGLVHLLDRRALELAAETLRTMPDVELALNVSAATIREEEAVEDYLQALKALGPHAERLTLELTETAAIDDPGLASYFSVETRKLGCGFAIDDFGSGYTTFRNLMAIEADAIKIDGSYIQGIATEPHKETFVRMMVDLAQTFSVKTVAEMVDDRADAELLRRLGVDYLQGYMFGIPSAAPAWRRETG